METWVPEDCCHGGCRKGKKHKDVLKQESDESKWKNMTPRERMREKKMQKADEEAERLK